MPTFRATLREAEGDKSVTIQAKSEIEIYKDMNAKGIKVLSIAPEKDARANESALAAKGFSNVKNETYLINSPFINFVTPTYCKYVFHLSIAFCFIASCIVTYNNAFIRELGEYVFSPVKMVIWIAISVVLSLMYLCLLRIALEGIIIVFSINNHLAWLRENQK